MLATNGRSRVGLYGWDMYAVDASTIDLCLAAFPWASFWTVNTSRSGHRWAAPDAAAARRGRGTPGLGLLVDVTGHYKYQTLERAAIRTYPVHRTCSYRM